VAKKCRDCVRCQETFVKVWVARPWRVTKTVSGGAVVNALRDSCPTCKHLMKDHKNEGWGQTS